MNKKRKLISYILIALLLFQVVIVYADNVTTTQQEEKINGKKELTLQDSIDYALENLNSIKQLEIQIKQQERALKTAKKEQDNTEYVANVYLPAGSGIQSLLTEKGYYKEKTSLLLQELQKQKEITIEQIMLAVENAYFNSKFSEINVHIEKENLERAQKEYEIVKKKYELGLATKADISNVELQLDVANNNYQNSIDNYTYSIMSFNNAVGLPLETEVILIDDLKYEPNYEIDLESIIGKALTDSYGITKAKNSYKLAIMYRDIINLIYAENTTYYKNAQDAVNIAQYTLEDVKKEITLKVTKAYMDLIKAERNLKTAQKSVELAKQAYEITKISYETGVNTSLDVSKARISLREAELGYNQALLAYNLSIKNFEMSYK